MKIISTEIPDVLIIEPRVFEDDPGFVFERFNERTFFEKTGASASFVQDNCLCLVKNVLRGLHYRTHSLRENWCESITGV